MTTLDLRGHQTGDRGVERVINALQKNRVKNIQSLYFPFNYVFTYISQTLTTLDMRGNRITDEGAKSLANGLKQNKVSRCPPFPYPLNHTFIIFHRP